MTCSLNKIDGTAKHGIPDCRQADGSRVELLCRSGCGGNVNMRGGPCGHPTHARTAWVSLVWGGQFDCPFPAKKRTKFPRERFEGARLHCVGGREIHHHVGRASEGVGECGGNRNAVECDTYGFADLAPCERLLLRQLFKVVQRLRSLKSATPV